MTKVCRECGRRFRPSTARPRCCPECGLARARQKTREYQVKHHLRVYRKRRCVAAVDQLHNVGSEVCRGYERYMRDPAAVEAACRVDYDPVCRYDLADTGWQNGIRVPSARMGSRT